MTLNPRARKETLNGKLMNQQSINLALHLVDYKQIIIHHFMIGNQLYFNFLIRIIFLVNMSFSFSTHHLIKRISEKHKNILKCEQRNNFGIKIWIYITFLRKTEVTGLRVLQRIRKCDYQQVILLQHSGDKVVQPECKSPQYKRVFK